MKKKIYYPDITNADPEYWEKVLRSYNLGVNQPLTDSSDEEITVEPPRIARHSSLTIKQNDMLHLRNLVDSDDRFMEGHEIKKAKGTQENRIAPSWALDNTKVREIILRAFPKALESEAQRRKAGRWIRAIHLYYRVKLLRSVVMRELGIRDLNTWLSLIRSIRRVAEGRRADGKGKRAMPSLVPLMREPGERGNE